MMRNHSISGHRIEHDGTKYLHVSGHDPIRVSRDVYRTYYHQRRKERYQEEQKKKHGTISLDAVGYNTNYLSRKPIWKESEIESVLVEKWAVQVLYEELDSLSSWDKRLIGLLYFSGITLKEAASVMKCSRGKVINHRNKVLGQIKERFVREGVCYCPV